jgi:cytochrome c
MERSICANTPDAGVPSRMFAFRLGKTQENDMVSRLAAGAIMAAVLAAGSASAQDAAKGVQVFRQCGVCHATEPGVTKLGPSMAGVVGRKAGTEPGFAYSDAMKAYGKVWDKDALDAYLTNPAAAVPNGKMVFAGLKDATQRADVIAYLETLK